jgi:hypothetical protein
MKNLVLFVCPYCYYNDLYGFIFTGGRRGRDLQLPMQSVHITTNAVSSNPAHGEVYWIQHYVIKSLRQVGGFLRVFRFPPPIKLTASI